MAVAPTVVFSSLAPHFPDAQALLKGPFLVSFLFFLCVGPDAFFLSWLRPATLLTRLGMQQLDADDTASRVFGVGAILALGWPSGSSQGCQADGTRRSP